MASHQWIVAVDASSSCVVRGFVARKFKMRSLVVVSVLLSTVLSTVLTERCGWKSVFSLDLFVFSPAFRPCPDFGAIGAIRFQLVPRLPSLAHKNEHALMRQFAKFPARCPHRNLVQLRIPCRGNPTFFFMVPFCIIPFGFMQDGAKQVRWLGDWKFGCLDV